MDFNSPGNLLGLDTPGKCCQHGRRFGGSSSHLICTCSPSCISQKSELTFVNSLGGKLELEFGQNRDLQELPHLRRASKIRHQFTHESCYSQQCPTPSSPLRVDVFLFKSLENTSLMGLSHEQSQLCISQCCSAWNPAWRSLPLDAFHPHLLTFPLKEQKQNTSLASQILTLCHPKLCWMGSTPSSKLILI